MRFPHSSSNANKIAQLIYKKGPMTLDQGIVYHGVMNGARHKTRAIYQNAIDCGWLVEKEGVYSLTDPLMNHMIGCALMPPSAAQNIAPPRLVNMWTKEMSIDASVRRKFGAA